MGSCCCSWLRTWAGRSWGWYGQHEGPGDVTRAAIPAAVIAARATTQRQAASAVEAETAKQILFADLHVHTTFSTDAILWSLPMMRGEGAHSIADACDYARFCSPLDFWSINDHAEVSTPRHWPETKEAIRQCNPVAAHAANPTWSPSWAGSGTRSAARPTTSTGTRT